jgi:chromosome partitioning protein
MKTKIIVFANQKGGVGKTSLCLLSAYYFAASVKTAVMDLDVQGSLSQLVPQDSGLTLIKRPASWQELLHLPFNILFIDTPPYLSADLPGLFAIADLVILPIKPGYFDALALKATMALVKAAKVKNAILAYGVVLNMVKPNTTITEEVKTLVKQAELPLLSTNVMDRVSYTRSLLNGGIMESSDVKAQFEISALADEMLNLLGL